MPGVKSCLQGRGCEASGEWLNFSVPQSPLLYLPDQVVVRITGEVVRPMSGTTWRLYKRLFLLTMLWHAGSSWENSPHVLANKVLISGASSGIQERDSFPILQSETWFRNVKWGITRIEQGSQPRALLTFGAESFFAVGLTVPGRMLSSTPGLHPLHAHPPTPIRDTQNVSRHCHVSPGGQVTPVENHC